MANFLSNILGGVTDTIYGEGYQPSAEQFSDPYAAENRQRLLQGLEQQQGRMAAIGQEDPWRERQLGLATQLEQQAAGEGPSLAQEQLREATDRNIRQQAGMMASQRGIGAGLAARMAGQQGAQAQQQMAGQAAQLRAQEQLGARQQLASALAQGRAGDIQIGGLSDAMKRFYDQSLASQSQQQMAAQMALSQARQQAAGQEATKRGQFLGALGGLAGYGSL